MSHKTQNQKNKRKQNKKKSPVRKLILLGLFFLFCFQVYTRLNTISESDYVPDGEKTKIEIVYTSSPLPADDFSIKPKKEKLSTKQEFNQFKDANAKEILCLAENIYWEVRGRSKKEMEMVASVTMNRVEENKQKVCSVVYAPKQFSWTFQGKTRKKIHKNVTNSSIEATAWEDSLKIAKLAVAYRLKDSTGGATFYHANYMTPSWNFSKLKKTKVGQLHTYYKRK